MFDFKHFFVIFLAFLAFCEVSAQSGPLAESLVGSFRGFWSNSFRGNNMANFIGIPYGKPPVSTFFQKKKKKKKKNQLIN